MPINLPLSPISPGSRDPTDPPVTFSCVIRRPRDTYPRPVPFTFCVIFQSFQTKAEPKASPRGGGRFSPGDGGGKGVSPRLNGGGAAVGRSVAASGRVAEGKPSSNRRWKVGVCIYALFEPKPLPNYDNNNPSFVRLNMCTCSSIRLLVRIARFFAEKSEKAIFPSPVFDSGFSCFSTLDGVHTIRSPTSCCLCALDILRTIVRPSDLG